LSVKTIADSYGSFVDDTVKTAFESRYSVPSFFGQAKESQKMPPLPPGAILDVTNNTL
jgi:hypothetical protein